MIFGIVMQRSYTELFVSVSNRTINKSSDVSKGSGGSPEKRQIDVSRGTNQAWGDREQIDMRGRSLNQCANLGSGLSTCFHRAKSKYLSSVR